MSTHQSGKGHGSFLREVKAPEISSYRIVFTKNQEGILFNTAPHCSSLLSPRTLGHCYSGRWEFSHRLQPGCLETFPQCCSISNNCLWIKDIKEARNVSSPGLSRYKKLCAGKQYLLQFFVVYTMLYFPNFLKGMETLVGPSIRTSKATHLLQYTEH